MHKHNIIYPYVRKGALVLHLAPLVCLVPPCFSVIIYISFPPICGVEGSYWRALQRCSSTRPKRECEDEGLSRQNEWAPPIVSRQNEQRKTCVMAQAGPLTVTRPALPTPAISILKPACRQGLLASLSLSQFLRLFISPSSSRCPSLCLCSLRFPHFFCFSVLFAHSIPNTFFQDFDFLCLSRTPICWWLCGLTSRWSLFLLCKLVL